MKLIVFVYLFLLFSYDFDDVLGKLCGRWYKGGLFGCCASKMNGCHSVFGLYNCWCDICAYPDEKTGICPEGSKLASANPPSMVVRTIPPSMVVRTIPVNNHIETTTTSDGGEVNNGEETQTQSADGDGANNGVGVVRGNVLVVAIVAVCMAMFVGGAADGGGIGVRTLLMVMEQLGKTV